MNKPFDPIQNVKNEDDLAKKVVRGIADVVRCLDDVRGRALTVSDLFLPAVEAQRSKLHELCYRLILIDPQVHGKRGEDTLWKKGYHDVFTTSKRLRQNADLWSEEECALVRGLLLSGIGYYHHLLLKLQADHGLDFNGIVDFSLNVPDYGLPKGKGASGKQETAPWVNGLAGRVLVYLGDLSRYMRDLEPGWDLGLSERMYLQAAALDPTQGRPHNQLGTLAGNRNYSLDAVYYYLRSLRCTEQIFGAQGNLCRTLEKNTSSVLLEPFGPVPANPVQKTINQLLVLVEHWYCDKSLENAQTHCAEVVEGLQKVVVAGPAVVEGNELNWDAPFMQTDPTKHLPPSCLLKFIGILLICVHKLKGPESGESSATVAVLLALMDHMILQVMGRWKPVGVRTRLRRRRRRTPGVGSGSASSDSDSESNVAPPTPDSSGDEMPDIAAINGFHDEDPLEHLSEEELLGPLCILLCWLQKHPETLNTCSSSQPLLNHLASFLNALYIHIAEGSERAELLLVPTAEDAVLRGLPALGAGHGALDWSLLQVPRTKQEETLVKVHRLIHYAQSIQGLNFDGHRFTVQSSPAPNAEPRCKGELMKHMGQLWLKQEVRDLETRTRRTPGEMSPYLVVDAEALVDHIGLVKQLVGSRQFILVIPIIVLALLDEWKRESGRSREAIRWLESQFQHGNRSLKSQKAQDKLSLSLIKYPKKKDKEAWNFFQMMECCYYLSKQNSLTVTFLTGTPDRTLGPDFSPSGVAKSFGISLEHIEAFYSKWKKPSKGNDK